MYAKVKAVEALYHVNSMNSVSPFAFSESVVGYSVSNSRAVVNLYNHAQPACSYTRMKTWLQEQATADPVFPQGDVHVAIDNDQIVGKTYRVKENSKVNVSVLTSVCYAQLDPEGKLQEDPALKPYNWFKYEGFSEKVQQIRNNTNVWLATLSDIHYQQLYIHIESRLKKVVNEQIVCDTQITDSIDKAVSLANKCKTQRQCQKCHTWMAKSKRICVNPECKVNFKLSEEKGKNISTFSLKSQRESKPTEYKVSFKQIECSHKFIPTYENLSDNTCDKRYANVSSKHPSQPPVAGVLDPVFVNPNSYESVKQVLHHVGKISGIKRYDSGTKEWISIYMDGLPYMLAHKLIRESYICPVCNLSVLGSNEFEDHCEEVHSNRNLIGSLEFDWVNLRIGPGHMEMNMIKSYFELNWETFLSCLSNLMGFCSEKAQKYAKRCSDNHKAWELLEIFYLGSTDELLIPYVRSDLLKKQSPSVEGFMKFLKTVTDPNYIYLAEQIFTYCQAIINYRAGVRRNNSDVMMAGRIKFSPIFHARNHPKYMYIDIADTIDRVIYPQKLRDFISQNESVSVSGDHSRGEGMDFILESFNKSSKTWVTGVPDSKEWVIIFRNLSKLNSLRKVTFENMGMQDPKFATAGTKPQKENEILAWRKHLRSENYTTTPDENKPHVSVTGKMLDRDLVNFSQNALNMRKRHIDVNFLGKLSDEQNYPVFVTPEEREYYTDIANQTKAVIERLIDTKISCILDTSVKDMYKHKWETEVKGQRKSVYVSFYDEIGTIIEQQQCIDDVCSYGDIDDV
ncbi:uncharacterized protein [Ptychodera flava]|uniref:uncharacterized protein n=1 Tax=Ptychodera flava TaxID=63121 RepID=UPI003969EF21